MMIVLKKNHTEQERELVLGLLEERGAKTQVTSLDDHTALVISPIKFSGPKVDWLALDGVDRVIQIKSDYPRIAKAEQRKTIRVGELEIGPGHCVVISGPCAVESEEQMVRIAKGVKEAGAHILRGGAFKPRTSPYTFQGLGTDGLKILAVARQETGLPVVTEALDIRELDRVAEYADIIQIGSRNMQNFPLLKEAGKLRRPILLKRGMSATIQEWLLAAEYIAEGGNTDIILCERGVRSFDTQTRNLLDISCVPVLKEETFLPVAVDPSHGTGRKDLIEPMALASLAAGADVIMIESHDEPEKALSDGFQALRPQQLHSLMQRLRRLAEALDISIP